MPYYHGDQGNLLLEEWMDFEPVMRERDLQPKETLTFTVYVGTNSDVEGPQNPIVFHLPNGERQEIDVVVER